MNVNVRCGVDVVDNGAEYRRGGSIKCVLVGCNDDGRVSFETDGKPVWQVFFASTTTTTSLLMMMVFGSVRRRVFKNKFLNVCVVRACMFMF